MTQISMTRTALVTIAASLTSATLFSGLLSSMAQADMPQPMHNYCQKQESMFLAIETRSYRINICGGDNPNTYVGVNKKTNQVVRVPLKDYDKRGRYFLAVNKGYSYILAQTPRGKFLTVSQGTRELLREPTIKGW